MQRTSDPRELLSVLLELEDNSVDDDALLAL